MYMTDAEKRMLDGEYGEGTQEAMKLLVALCKVFDAEKFIPIKHAHIAGTAFKTHDEIGRDWLENLARKGARVRVPTTLNVISMDRSRDLGQPKALEENQLRSEKAYEDMGIISLNTCTPYWCGYAPRLGESVSWAESSAVVYCNSVLGARDNREGGHSALAAGICGVTPYYGMHITENRWGQVLVKVKEQPRNYSEFAAMGTYVGTQIVEQIAVFTDVTYPTNEDLAAMGAALASAGGTPMFHVLGHTPEAHTMEQAFGNNTKYEVIEITRAEIKKGFEIASRAKSRQVELVTLGCPHVSINQVKEIAEKLDGKKVNDGCRLWIQSSAFVKGMAKQLGYMDIIEKAGGVIVQDICTNLAWPELLGVKTMASNSTKVAFYTPGSNGLDVWCGTTDECLEAAVTGIFPESKD